MRNTTIKNMSPEEQKEYFRQLGAKGRANRKTPYTYETDRELAKRSSLKAVAIRQAKRLDNAIAKEYTAKEQEKS